MKQSKLFTKTLREAPADADSPNAQLLTQAGFIDQLSAGIYTYLPLGLRVLDKIKNIVREEMNAIDGQEILMPALQPAEPWKATGRWDDPGPEVMFQFKGRGNKDMGLGWTHEDIVTPIVKKFANSYKDFPITVYQIQDKFRNELRAKSGLLRGREFSMKDLYSFHLSEADRAAYYNQVADAYHKVFKRCGLAAIKTEASGGSFGDVSHEYQVPNESGEDTIFVNQAGDYAWNKEIVPKMKDGDDAPDGSGPVKEMKAIEVGNIFPLGTRFSEAFDFKMKDENGKMQKVIMSSYGIGPSRVMGTVVDVLHDERGMIWPKSIAPFSVHLISLSAKDEETQAKIDNLSEELYNDLTDSGVDVLWDDRAGLSPGAKFADADLFGIPLRLVLSERTLKEDSVEWKERASDEIQLIKQDEIIEAVSDWVAEE